MDWNLIGFRLDFDLIFVDFDSICLDFALILLDFGLIMALVALAAL